jgi:hypothetical protein
MSAPFINILYYFDSFSGNYFPGTIKESWWIRTDKFTGNFTFCFSIPTAVFPILKASREATLLCIKESSQAKAPGVP